MSILNPISSTEYSLKLWKTAWNSYLKTLNTNTNKIREEQEFKGLPTNDEFIISFFW